MSSAINRTLRAGLKGPDVRRLQEAIHERLSARGQLREYPVDVDGEVGMQTLRGARRTVYLLGMEDDTREAITAGRIGERAQEVIRHPERRGPRALERARKRMAVVEKDKAIVDVDKYRRGTVIRLATHAARLALAHAPEIHYTQGPRRWDGINLGKIGSQGEFPLYADCSSFYTWLLWQGLRGTEDVVNGADWQAGYTGTLLTHGRRVDGAPEGAAVLYGRGWPGAHVAYSLGNGQVISHGSEGGPYLLPLRYRSDVLEVRAYI